MKRESKKLATVTNSPSENDVNVLPPAKEDKLAVSKLPLINRLLPELAPPGENTISLSKALTDPRNSHAKSTLAIGTFFMIVLPILTFFVAARTIFAPVSLGGIYSDQQSLTYSGFAAAMSVNIVSVGYVVYAVCFDPERNADYPEEVNQSRDRGDAKAEPRNKKTD